MGDDFTSSTSTTGVLTPGGEIKGAIDYNNDKDWIKIQLTAGVLYKFDLLGSKSSGGTLADPYLRLYDSSGRSLSQSAYKGGAYGDPNLGYIPVSSGNYYVEVSSFDSGETGSYTVRVSQASGSDDFTSSTSTTGVLTPGGEIKGAIDYNNDKDWIKIQLTAGVLYKFDLSGSKSSGGTLADPYLRLYDSSGRSLSQSAYKGGAYGDPNLGYIPVSSDYYYVEVSSFDSGETGSYTLRVSQAGNYTVDSVASTVNEGSTATFNLTTTNVAAGTAVAYTISGISASDVTGGKLSGSVTVGSDGKATISVPIAADQTTEGDETLTVTVQGKSASTVVKDTSIGTSTTTKSALTVLVDKGVLGPTPTLLKGLAEEIVSNGTAKLSHTVTYNGVKFKYADIDPLIMTVLRDGNFTDEFRQEIADLVPSLKDISFDVAVKFVGTANIDSVIVNVAGADGNFVG